jgi:hypothetical protein
MPWGDRTGPEGFGPMSGRGLGYCSGSGRPGYMNNYAPRRGYARDFGGGYGYGYGRGRGFGRGYGRAYYGPNYAPYSYEPDIAEKNELEYLKNTAKVLEDELKEVQKRLEDLKDEDNKQKE